MYYDLLKNKNNNNIIISTKKQFRRAAYLDGRKSVPPSVLPVEKGENFNESD